MAEIAIFDVYREDGTLQLDIASALPQTLGVIRMRDYMESNGQWASGTIPIPQWAGGRRGWWNYEGFIPVTTITCPTIIRVGDSIQFRIGGVSAISGWEPRIKYGVY